MDISLIYNRTSLMGSVGSRTYYSINVGLLEITFTEPFILFYMCIPFNLVLRVQSL